MHSRRVFLLLSCVLLLASTEAMSQQSDADTPEDDVQEAEASDNSQQPERQPIPDYPKPSIVRRSIVIVDDAQRIASERFGNFMGQVDGFFSNAGSNDDAVSNGSWARIRVDGIRANGNDFELDQSIKLRAVLPRTERKLKLLVSTEENESDDSSDVQTISQRNDQNASLALRFIRTARANSDVNLDVGVRRRDSSVQTFVRLNARYSLNTGAKWTSNVANSYQHYSKSGYGNKLSFDFRRLLYKKDNLFFRTYTQFNWEKGQSGTVIGHTTGLYWQLGEHRALALEGLASYNTALRREKGVNDRFSGHEFRIRWRDSLGRPWLFYEIWPSVAWPSSTRYKRTNGFLLRLEFIIGYRG